MSNNISEPAERQHRSGEPIHLVGYMPNERQFLTQDGRILELLREGRRDGKPVPSPKLGRIALQYGRAIHSLRKKGFRIKNSAWREGGQIRTTFELLAEPNETLAQQPLTLEVSDGR